MLVATLKSRAAVEAAARDKLKLPADQVETLITEAYARILAAALYHKQAAAGEALTRLHDLYERSLTIQDVKTALAAQKELNRLQDLYSFRPPAAGDLAPPRSATPPADAPPDTLQGLRLIG